MTKKEKKIHAWLKKNAPCSPFPYGHINAVVGSVVGTNNDYPPLVLDMDVIIRNLTKEMSYENAVEYFWYNIEGTKGSVNAVYVQTVKEPKKYGKKKK